MSLTLLLLGITQAQDEPPETFELDEAPLEVAVDDLAPPTDLEDEERDPDSVSISRTKMQRAYANGTRIAYAGITTSVGGAALVAAGVGVRSGSPDALGDLRGGGLILAGGVGLFTGATLTTFGAQVAARASGTPQGASKAAIVLISTTTVAWFVAAEVDDLPVSRPLVAVGGLCLVGSHVPAGIQLARNARHGRARRPHTLWVDPTRKTIGWGGAL